MLPRSRSMVLINGCYFEGSRPEWCISSMIYSRDTPFWLETLDLHCPLCVVPGLSATRGFRFLILEVSWLFAHCTRDGSGWFAELRCPFFPGSLSRAAHHRLHRLQQLHLSLWECHLRRSERRAIVLHLWLLLLLSSAVRLEKGFLLFFFFFGLLFFCRHYCLCGKSLFLVWRLKWWTHAGWDWSLETVICGHQCYCSEGWDDTHSRYSQVDYMKGW